MAMRPIFQCFCINRFGIGLLHYISSRSDFGFEFADIFAIDGSPTRRVGESRICNGESGSRYSKFFLFIIDLQNFKQLNQNQFSKK